MFFFFFTFISREEQIKIDNRTSAVKHFTYYNMKAEPGTKDELLINVNRLQDIIHESGRSLNIVGINKLYPCHCICEEKGILYHYSIVTWRREQIIQDREFRGWADKSNWENAPNYINVEDIQTYEGDL